MLRVHFQACDKQGNPFDENEIEIRDFEVK